MAFPTSAQFEAAFSIVYGAAGDPSTIHVNNLYTALKGIFSQLSGTFDLPSYTTAERDALTGMDGGSVIFNDTTNKLNFYTGAAWEAVTSA